MQKTKYVETDYNRIVECELNAIYSANSRLALIDIFTACRKVVKPDDLKNFIIPACKDRQAFLIREGIITL